MAADLSLQRGQYQTRFAAPDEVARCQRLRHHCFHGRPGVDVDRFDDRWRHLMVVDAADTLVATLRLQLGPATGAGTGYAGLFYDLTHLSQVPGTVMEMGRFCVTPDRWDPQILRMIWATLARLVDAHYVSSVFGCTSFAGTNPRAYAHAFARLARHHSAPMPLPPTASSHRAVKLSAVAAHGMPQAPMPPLLRTYLAMGGWVSDHAVIDPQMNTLHVLTGLDVAKVPPARAKVLRALV